MSKHGKNACRWHSCATAGVSAALYLLPTESSQPQAALPEPKTGPLAVASLGRIEPGDGVMRIAAPYYSGRPSVVRELYVQEGGSVQKGQMIAVLDGNEELQARLQQTEARVELARSHVERVKAGAKPADLAAQRAEIRRLEVLLENAQAELQRYEQLRKQDDISPAEFDVKRTAVQSLGHTIEQAKQKLESLAEVRKIDVDVAESELKAALADVQRARVALQSSIVYSPATGRVIQVHARAGEEAGPLGIVEIAETSRMYAIAEVYESDISRVKIGQKAVITSELLSGPLNGLVESIGSEVAKAQVLPTDPTAFADTRVIHVRVRFKDPRPVAALIHGKVAVRILP